jgi:hypothetical protein
MISWLLVLLWTGLAWAGVSNQYPAPLVTRGADVAQHCFRHTGTQEARCDAMTPADYAGLGQPNTGTPDAPAEPGPWVWLGAELRATFNTPSTQLATGDCYAWTTTIQVGLPNGGVYDLPRPAYTLTCAPSCTITPNPPGMTVINGTLTITDASMLPTP